MKWVDDTHALGVFSSTSLGKETFLIFMLYTFGIARRALDMEFLVFKVRPISEATSLSKTIAKKCGGICLMCLQCI